MKEHTRDAKDKKSKSSQLLSCGSGYTYLGALGLLKAKVVSSLVVFSNVRASLVFVVNNLMHREGKDVVSGSRKAHCQHLP